MKIKIANKGYTLVVVSWENDADYKSTISKTFETKDEAKAVQKLCEELFVSRSSNKKAIGNLTNDEYGYQLSRDSIYEYLLSNPDVAKGINIDLEAQNNEKDDEVIIDIVMDYNWEMMGSSEFYYSRVCDSAVLYKLDEDVYADLCDE